MADTLSSDSKTVVQALYDAIAAGDVERFFGAMHSQFEAELPGYLPWGGIHNGPDAFKANVLPGMASKIDLASIKRVPIGDSRTWP
jgi:ketosteroid isomerase-like protein